MKPLAELQIAVMMLTRLPAGQVGPNPPSVAASSWAFPLVGALVGAIAAVVLLALTSLGIGLPLAAGMALVAMVVITGGLHEDGLADVADGFGGGGTRERKLEIMRDSQIGSYGALALVLSLGLRWQGLVAVLVLSGPMAASVALLALAVASRAGLATALWLMPPARTDGMGQSASGATMLHALVAALVGFAALVALLGTTGLVVALVAAMAMLGFASLAKRQIGGQTGDVLGAMQQIAEIAGWVALSALL